MTTGHIFCRDPELLQVQDYLNQVLAYRGEEIIKVSKVSVARVLNVCSGTVFAYLNDPIRGKLFENFQEKFPKEMNSWPKNSAKIGKTLSGIDIKRFFGHADSQPDELQLSARNVSPIQLPGFDELFFDLPPPISGGIPSSNSLAHCPPLTSSLSELVKTLPEPTVRYDSP